MHLQRREISMRKTIAASLAGLILVSAAAPALAMPAVGVAPAVMRASDSGLLQEARWHGRRGGYHSRRHYHHHHDNNNWGGVAAAGVLGLATGAIIGSAAARPAPPPAYYAPPSSDWAAYCASKYRSFDIRTGTYLGYDGYRHPCR
jgi:hypothetical protein